MDDDIEDSPQSNSSSTKQLIMKTTSPNKRPLNLTGSQFAFPTPTDTEESSNSSSTMEPSHNSRPGSPAPSTSTLSSIETSRSEPAKAAGTSDTTNSHSTLQPPTKRRKLTPSEKLQKQQEAEDREREKAAKKVQKEEEKKLRDEEKRVRDEEKRKKAEDREMKKRTKELEEERRTQEKLKKERSQMRLGAFFQSKVSTDNDSSSEDPLRRKSRSLEPYEESHGVNTPVKARVKDNLNIDSRSPASIEFKALSEYSSFFLPFEVPSHSTVAQIFTKHSEHLHRLQHTFDCDLDDQSLQAQRLHCLDRSEYFAEHFKQNNPDRGIPIQHMKAVIDQINGVTPAQPIDLTEDSHRDNLEVFTRRLLHFEQDLRPPYFGSYTKIRRSREKRRLGRNPFLRARVDTNYDYDSEADYVEPEIDDAESEGLSGDDEDDTESVGDGDEMDGFLEDDEDLQKQKRRNPIAELQPINTGICWADRQGVLLSPPGADTENGDSVSAITSDMSIRILLPGMEGNTIDPFSTIYWQKEMAPPAPPRPDLMARLSANPRPPLKERSSNSGFPQQTLLGACEGEKGPITSVEAVQESKRGRKALPKVLGAEEMDSFKDAVNGSPLAKADLLKGLKQRFPKITNDVIKDTLGSYFAQQGSGKMKRWIFTGSIASMENSQGAALGN